MDTPAVAPTLVVLAAGMGSRFGGLKQITPVNNAGEAILDYSVYDAARAGFQRVVFVIRHDIEAAFRANIGNRFEQRIDVGYAFQELAALPAGFAVPPGRTRPWGTLQATLAGAQAAAGPFAVINADDFYGMESYRVFAKHLSVTSSRNALVGYQLRNTLSDFGAVSRGICQVGPDGLLKGLEEQKKIVRSGSGAIATEDNGNTLQLSGDETVSMNMWGFQPTVVPLLQDAFTAFLQGSSRSLDAEAYLPEAVGTLLLSGEMEVEVLRTASEWFGMTYREDLAGVVANIGRLTAAGSYPARLWA